MLDVAREREVEGDLLLSDLGHGLPLRAGAFDGAISISAVQWLCNAVRPRAARQASSLAGAARSPRRRMWQVPAAALHTAQGESCRELMGSSYLCQYVLQAAGGCDPAHL